MAARTVARLFDDHAAAEAAVRGLESAGFSDRDISLVCRQGGAAGAGKDTADSAAGIGATIGGVMGGGAGLLAGLGLMAIPGQGPVVVAAASSPSALPKKRAPPRPISSSAATDR